MSEIKVNKITPRAACGTTQLGDSGDTFTVPSGATISNLGTATGFGGTGVVSWDTGSIKTTGFTAVTGTGYFCDTTGGGFTVTLPLSPAAGAVVGVADYAQTFDTDNLTLGRNGSNIGGQAIDAVLTTEGIAVTLVYVDATKGWIVTDSGLQSEATAPVFVAATGGCITTCGNFKMHTFYSPGSLCVSCGGNSGGSNTVSYMVVAGGGGTSVTEETAGAGGAGGFREGKASSDCYTASPLNAPAGLSVSVQAYPIQVGGGGVGATTTSVNGGSGTPSIFSSITSTGGGGGGYFMSFGSSGGSGGGGAARGPAAVGGTGNTPVVAPIQGNDGGDAKPLASPSIDSSGGGGGAGAVGADGNEPGGGGGGNGGIGVGTAINLSTMPAPSPTPSAQIGTPGPTPAVRYFAGGGGGSAQCTPVQGTGGAGGGGAATAPDAGTVGTINTGGGAGAGILGNNCGVNGGSGIVVIRYKYQ